MLLRTLGDLILHEYVLEPSIHKVVGELQLLELNLVLLYLLPVLPKQYLPDVCLVLQFTELVPVDTVDYA